jgi:hypothetical protein
MMDEGASQAAASTTGQDVAAQLRSDALGRLRHGWGEAYRIGWNARHGWWARRRDSGDGVDITGANADALWDAIRKDYDSNPVPRDVGAGQAAPS